MKFLNFLSFAAVLLFSGVTFAQTGTIKGFVYIEKTGEPAIFTNVVLEGTTYGTATDGNGYFSLSRIPVGEYSIKATSIGYRSSESKVKIEKEGQLLNVKLFISEAAFDLEAVEVSAEKQEAQSSVKVSVTKLTPKEIKKLPAIGGDPDLAQYLQVLPGVVFTGDQGGQLYIRGGSPIQNKVLLDGLIIYNPFHSIGLFSVFETDILKTADVYTGGFGAEYGGRISSIMDIKTKDGNKQRLGGKISASTFGTKALIEGPLSKPKALGDKSGGSSSFILSYKNSYLDRVAPVLYDYADTAGLPFNFNDFYGKVSLNASNGSKVNFFGFSFNDAVNYPDVAGFSWNEFGIGSNFVFIPARSTTLIEGTIAYSSYEIEADENEAGALITDRRSMIDGFNAGMNFTNFNGNNESKFGFELLGFTTDFAFTNNVNQEVSQLQNTTEIAGFFQYKFNLGKLILEPSMRLHYYASLSTFSPEPRIGFKYNLTDNIRLKGAGGLYSQNLLSASSDRDVVNLFYGFLSGPDNLQDEFLEDNGSIREVSNPLQRATHTIFGSEFDLTKHLNLNVEGFYKWFNQITNINRNRIRETDSEFILETGNAYGVDFAFKYDKKQLSLWAVYSWSFVDRWDGIQTYNPIWDRRHNINLVGSYGFGKDLVWNFDARWNIGSGFPVTETEGFYELLTLQGDIGQNFQNQNGELGIRFGELNGGRLPWYHRFDVSLKRVIALSEHSILEITGSITNVYNRDNIFFVNRVTNERIDQLPILPSIGASLTF